MGMAAGPLFGLSNAMSATGFRLVDYGGDLSNPRKFHGYGGF